MRAALRSGAAALGVVVVIVLGIFALFGFLEFNAWLVGLITETRRGYSVAALFIALVGTEVGVSIAVWVAVKTYRRKSNG